MAGNEVDDNHWKGKGGEAWVKAQPLLDATFEAVCDLLCEELKASGARRVLDIGCGAGATSLAAARLVGTGGQVTGADISEVMLAHAQKRAEAEGLSIAFLCGDAGKHDFDAGQFDHLISRFGVMFFDDAVAAFTNLRGAMKPGGKMSAVAWRSPQENPFMTAAARAARPFVPEAFEGPPPETGQFAFADDEKVRGILEAAGWQNVSLEAVSVPCASDEAAVELYATRMGPIARVLPTLEPALREKLETAMVGAVREYVSDGKIRFDAACWMIRATA